MLTPVNGSSAALGLGIAGVDSLNAANLDGKIDGRQVTGVKLTDRFFMKDASVSADVTLGAATFDGSSGSVVSATDDTIKITAHGFKTGAAVVYRNGDGTNTSVGD